jgi:hypothetical protein
MARSNINGPTTTPAPASAGSGASMMERRSYVRSTSLSNVVEHGVAESPQLGPEASRCVLHKNKKKGNEKKSKSSLRKKEMKAESLSVSSGADSESKKKRNSKAFYKILNDDPSPTSVRNGLMDSDLASYTSASSRLSASSAANRGEMRTIIHSIRQHKNCIGDRAKSVKQLGEVTQQFEEERRAMLLKWEAMSAKRKLSRLRSSKDSTSRQHI